MASFTAGTTFTDGVANDVTAAKLGALVTNATPTSGFIQDRTAETVIASNDTVLIGDASDSNNLKRMTVDNLMKAEMTGTINSTSGTIGSLTTGTGTAASPAIIPTGDTNNGLFFPAADNIAVSTNGTERVRVDSSGNVGIGTASPATRLDVNDGSANVVLRGRTGTGYSASLNLLPNGLGAGVALASQSDSSAVLYNQLNSYLALGTNNTERLRIDSSGNVGIGTTSPSAKLDVRGNSLFGANGRIQIYETGGDAVIGGAAGTNYTAITVNATERLRITSGAVLTFAGSTETSPVVNGVVGIAIDGSNNYAAFSRSGNEAVGIGRQGSDGAAVRFYRSTTNVGNISVTATATAYNTSSDYRLKTNLEPILNGIDRIKQLPVYRFNWIADESGNKVDGFVAHEAQAIVPECVTGEKDAVDADGKPIYQGIDQSKIVPLLTAALKEAIAKIEQLESKVAALEAA